MEPRERMGRTITLPGIAITFSVDGPSYTVADAQLEPGFAPTPHVHRTHHETFLVVEGPVDFLVGDETLRVDDGGVVDVPPGVVHDFHNAGQGVARIACFASPGGLHAYFAEIDRMVQSGSFDAPALAALRERYDTESVHLVWRAQTP